MPEKPKSTRRLRLRPGEQLLQDLDSSDPSKRERVIVVGPTCARLVSRCSIPPGRGSRSGPPEASVRPRRRAGQGGRPRRHPERQASELTHPFA